MIQVINKDYNKVSTRYIGKNKKQFLKYFNIMKEVMATYDKETNGWIIGKDIVEQLKNKFELKIIEQPWEQMGSDLLLPPYNYQKEIIHFCKNNYNGLIISPPGTGKTICAIGAYLELLKNKVTDKPGVICVKASLKYQWVREIHKFSNLRAKAVNTPSKARKKFDSQFEDVDLLVLNYETFKNEAVANKLREIGVESIFLDEIHYIGASHKTAKSKALYNFNDLKIKIGFTATPITRDPENLFCIFNMINPDLFKNHSNFAKSFLKYASFGRISGVKNKDILKQRIAPYIFIKKEEEIAKQMPKLMVNEIHCEMTDEMLKVNNKLFQKLNEIKEECDRIEKKLTPKELETNEEYNQLKTQILAYQTFAQELIDDPRLFDMSDSKLLENYKLKTKKSPKLDLLLDIVSDLLDNNSKVCIFTRFERMQSIIQREIENKFKIKCAIINGSLSSEERTKQAYDLFQDTDEYKVLIATNAMSEGVSLSKCNYLIEYDLADSYAMQTQRHGRVRRADSINSVSYIYQLIMDEPNGNSWDLITQKIISKKRNYDNDIIQDLK